MRKQTEELCKSLETAIQAAYEETPTIPEAEKLAARFLHAQMVLANELRIASLDARMRRSGLKAIRGAIYMEVATQGDRKPSDAMIGAQVDMHELVTGEQKAFDEAETAADFIQNYLNIAKEGHIYFRSLAKSSFGG